MADTNTYDPLTGIAWDTRLSGTQIGTYFYPGGLTIDSAEEDGIQTSAFNAYQTGRFQAALQTFSNVSKLTFTPMARPAEAQLRFFLSPFAPTETGETLGYAFAPGYSGTSGLAGFNNAARGWSDAPGGPLEAGGNAFTTLIHELGHAVGLAHPHDDGGNSTIFPGVENEFRDAGDYGLNQGIYTMMSYRDGWADGPADLPAKTDLYGEESTPMAFDVAVLQQKYGANTAFAAGDDTYVLPGQNGTGTSYVCIWDAGGSNALRYDGSSDAVLDLRPATLKFETGGGGWLSYVHGVHGGYTIANGVSIQTAAGGTGNDMLTANDSGCVLAGGLGQNTILGGVGGDTVLSTGEDTVLAGAGANLISLTGARATVGLAGQDTVVAGAGAETVGVWGGDPTLMFAGSGLLTFVAGAGASTVVAGGGSVTVFGGTGGGLFAGGTAGSNVLVAGTGAATVIGGGSGDLLFAGGSGQVLSAGSGNETLVGAGAAGGNTFFAGSGACVVGGGTGNDTVFAGTGSATVDGGAGANLLAFSAARGGGQVLVNNFHAEAGDRVTLQGYGAVAADAAVAGSTRTGQGVTLTLSDQTRITFAGLESISGSVFV